MTAPPDRLARAPGSAMREARTAAKARSLSPCASVVCVRSRLALTVSIRMSVRAAAIRTAAVKPCCASSRMERTSWRRVRGEIGHCCVTARRVSRACVTCPLPDTGRAVVGIGVSIRSIVRARAHLRAPEACGRGVWRGFGAHAGRFTCCCVGCRAFREGFGSWLRPVDLRGPGCVRLCWRCRAMGGVCASGERLERLCCVLAPVSRFGQGLGRFAASDAF